MNNLLMTWRTGTRYRTITGTDRYQESVICFPAELVLMTYLATGFQASDQDTTGILQSCLDSISSHPFFRSIKEESYRLLNLVQPSAVLEVGCGTGSDAWRLVEFTGASGLVIGIDPGLAMIQTARRIRNDLSSSACSNQGIPHFLRMDGRYLGFPDCIFDAVREDRALQHISYPEQVIGEMLRVLKPGGSIVIFEPDWELFIIEGQGKILTRTILNFWTDTFMNGWIGRSLFRICSDSGVREITIHPRTLILHDLAICNQIFAVRDTVTRAGASGIISPDDAEAWIMYIEEADRAGRFFCSFTGYLIHGKK